jgi:hypothetical protein
VVGGYKGINRTGMKRSVANEKKIVDLHLTEEAPWNTSFQTDRPSKKITPITARTNPW